MKTRCRVILQIMPAASDDIEPGHPTHRYVIFGLHVSSELRLVESSPAVATPLPPADVIIRHEALTPLTRSLTSSAMRVDSDDVQLDIENVARYRVRGGGEIGVDPSPGVSLRALRVYLLGPVFGVLFHHRRLLPLHASAIVVDGQAVLFAGNRGIGKSTLAAYFDSRGYAALADDVCVLSRGGDGRLVAWPDLRRLKLRSDAADRFGYDAASLERSVDHGDKFQIPLRSLLPEGGFPLSRVYVLNDMSTESTGEVSPLNGVAAIEAIVSNTYAASYFAHTGLSGKHLSQWTRVARHIPIFAARRRRGYDAFVDEAARLERHFTQPATSGV